MALSMQQVQRQTQRLIMTPQMQQSIQLLQMNSMDLEQLIRHEMEENPFLEIADDEEALQTDAMELSAPDAAQDEGPAEAIVSDSGLSDQLAEKAREVEAVADEPWEEREYLPGSLPDRPADEPGVEAAATDSEDATFESMAETDVDWKQEYEDSDTVSFSSVAEDVEENDFTEYTPAREGLHESLRRQLALSSLSGKMLAIGEFLVGNVNDDGYIECSLDNLAMMAGYPVEFIRPDRAGKAEFVDRRLRRALAKLFGGVNPDSYTTMKRKELLTRIFAKLLGLNYDAAALTKREDLLRGLIALRVARDAHAFDGMHDEDLLLEVVAYRMKSQPDVVYEVLEVLQDFEPTGVCARNLAECLRLQCEERNIRNRLVYRILEGQLDGLLQKKFRDVARALNSTEDAVAEVFTLVSKLEPRPGRSKSKETPRFITPDVYVKKVDGKYLYYLNEGDTGRLMVASKYRRMLKPGESTPPLPESSEPGNAAGMNGAAPAMVEEVAPAPSGVVIDRDFAQHKYKSAIWLIKNIEKRKTTILRVTEAIMEFQRAFLEKGIEHLRPLTLRDIAEVVGMHESTIARVTANKFVETPRGVYPLKYFFNSGLETDEGDMAASRAIKELITQLIAAENPKRPLSDQKIADKLRDKGIQIARRTVAKYREQLKILPARLRKEVRTAAPPQG